MSQRARGAYLREPRELTHRLAIPRPTIVLQPKLPDLYRLPIMFVREETESFILRSLGSLLTTTSVEDSLTVGLGHLYGLGDDLGEG